MTAAPAADAVNGHLMLVSDNAGWSWFQDERAIVDPAGAHVLVAAIGNRSGSDGAHRAGVVDVSSFPLATRRVIRVPLGTLADDDHNAPALLVRPDGRYLAVYNDHNADDLTRIRISVAPGDPRSWQALPDFTNPATVTYANLLFLAAEGKTYDFNRSLGYDPNYLVSTDQGSTWAYGGKLLRDPDDSDDGRPYVKYASNGVDRIDFITTEAHPRDQDTGVYHGYLRAGKLYRSDGTLVGELGTAPRADAFTPLLLPGQLMDGTPRDRAWTTDLSLDGDGAPVAVFTSRVDDSILDHRLYYGRLAGGAWKVEEMARAGVGLYWPEADYTGLAAIDPRDPGVVYISSAIDPGTGAASPFHEIFAGVTTDAGTSWTWTPITEHSTVDNLRPVAAKWSDGSAVLWLRGTYRSYTDYDMAVVGVVQQDGQGTGKVRYIDATTSNTTLAGGEPLTTTGPTTDGGGTDDLWHRRTGVGNGGEVFTAGEGGDEDAPRLKTTIVDAATGEHDVFAFFWADPAEDWQISLGLAGDEMRTFRQDFCEQADPADFSTPMVLTGPSVRLYTAYLGRVSLVAPATLPIFVDDSPLALGSGSRTWYDGVGLAAVTQATRRASNSRSAAAGSSHTPPCTGEVCSTALRGATSQ